MVSYLFVLILIFDNGRKLIASPDYQRGCDPEEQFSKITPSLIAIFEVLDEYVRCGSFRVVVEKVVINHTV